MTVLLQTRRFTVEEFHRMVEAGILAEDDRVELLDGEIVEMTPIGPAHAECVRRLDSILHSQVGHRAIVSVQNAVQLDERSELYPDVAMLRPMAGGYGKRHPGPADVLLVIEVADTTVESDRSHKIPRYAQAGILEVWLIDLRAEQVEVFRQPAPGGYQLTRSQRRGDRIELHGLSGLAVLVSEILP